MHFGIPTAVLVVAVAAGHGYLWLRFVRDTGHARAWGRAAAAALVLLGTAVVNALEPDLVAITGDLVDGTVASLGPSKRDGGPPRPPRRQELLEAVSLTPGRDPPPLGWMKKLVVLCHGDCAGTGSWGAGLMDADSPATLRKRGVDVIEYDSPLKATGKWDDAIPLTGQEGTGVHDWVYFFGDHGNFRPLKEGDFLYQAPSSSSAAQTPVYGPTALNGRSYGAVKTFVDGLERRSFKAKVIWLDCCWSAGFIPLMSRLLAESGHIVGFFCPAINPALIGLKRLLAEGSLNRGGVAAFTRELGWRDEQVEEGSEAFQGVMTARRAFTQVCYSRHRDRVFRDENFQKVADAYAVLTFANVEERENEVRQLAAYLNGQGFQISDVSNLEMHRRMTTYPWSSAHDTIAEAAS